MAYAAEQFEGHTSKLNSVVNAPDFDSYRNADSKTLSSIQNSGKENQNLSNLGFAPAESLLSGAEKIPFNLKSSKLEEALKNLNTPKENSGEKQDAPKNFRSEASSEGQGRQSSNRQAGRNGDGLTDGGAESKKRANDGQSEGNFEKPSATGKEDRSNLTRVLPRLLDQIGKSVTKLEPGLSSRLGCARAVSEVLGDVPKTNNLNQLEKGLKDNGYEAVPVDQMKPGDVIIGKRPNGMPGHAAIYMGDGQVFNNNSNSGQMQIDSADKFKQGMHDAHGNFNKNGFSDVVVYRKKA